LGILLHEGIGDTIRVSLAAEPHEEVRVGWEILKSLELRKRGVTVVACPTCGRLDVDNFVEIVTEVERRLAHVEEPLHLSIMGCAVNGPGEAHDSQLGVTFGRNVGMIFKNGVPMRRVSGAILSKNSSKKSRFCGRKVRRQNRWQNKTARPDFLKTRQDFNEKAAKFRGFFYGYKTLNG
jgi:4-hydroxy-3-methylbut-2-en-1-yl diphosphate synthase IspG/GcpE